MIYIIICDLNENKMTHIRAENSSIISSMNSGDIIITDGIRFIIAYKIYNQDDKILKLVCTEA